MQILQGVEGSHVVAAMHVQLSQHVDVLSSETVRVFLCKLFQKGDCPAATRGSQCEHRTRTWCPCGLPQGTEKMGSRLMHLLHSIGQKKTARLKWRNTRFHFLTDQTLAT